MKEIAVTFRAAQLYAHMAHNLASGPTFLEDHEFFGELYGVYESAYDAIVERMIGLYLEPDLGKINTDAAAESAKYQHATNEDCYKALLDFEKDICAMATEAGKGASVGTQNLLAQFCDDSEARQYKMQQRLK